MRGTERNPHTELTDDEVRELIRQAQAGDVRARERLVEGNVRLVWSVVQRFLHRGYEADDLFQIGAIGLIKAIDKFDLSYDVKFSTYAVPMIIGEIQRHLRDDGEVKVSRAVKELGHKIRRMRDELTKQLMREPTLGELAEALGVPPDEVLFAQEATREVVSIHETVYENDGDPIALIDQLAEGDDAWLKRVEVRELVARLPERERLIVYLRFFKDYTQQEVAERLGVSQVQVSRLEKRILQKLRELIEPS
ncbi:MAG: RNA polymerase sporulation specific sigma factor SigF [Brockia lithotrophica]|uniref:RNA polymerase sigma factor n=1 Tax=Brockia lithotrophica TaxID=933949 RepID=A0A2T5G607_9BACL|nr:MAG: RNA polymerase sporulation specific sigma factor SigF [Brockia lithotrophica]